MIPNQLQPTVKKDLGPPPRNKIEFMLLQGPDMIPSVQDWIEKYKLPYTVQVSDGMMENSDGKVMPAGYGVLKDTLSRGELHLNQFITVDEETVEMKRYASLMAKSQHEVLIVGETGTGKEILAKSMIADRKGHIKAVNCAGFPETLIESELFGHTKGSFTGADREKQGLMSAAADGVMFLDEIGELPMSVQAKLLRALQERRIRKVGALVDEEITCKFVCATHRDLKQMVKDGQFRKDLFARISTLELHIKSLLPDRKDDIVPITQSLKGGEEFLKVHQANLLNGLLDLSLNVRSLQQHVIRFSVLGKVVLNA